VTDLIKGVLAGGWSLVLGWLLPAGVSVGTFALLVGPHIAVLPESVVDRSLLALAATVTLGILLAAIQTPLYRVLEGYLLWPSWLARRRVERHIAIRAELAVATEEGYRAGLVEEKKRRYPEDEKDIVPTVFGNAIRRFELYGWSRYRLNTQVLWYRIIAVAPEPAVKAVENARANVDFFVCLLYGQLLVAVVAVPTIRWTPRLIAVLIPLAIAAACYRLATLATDEWAASVRALTDLARLPLARALGLVLPASLEDERQMWDTVYWLERAPYSPKASGFLEKYRDGG
jgi:hypothetical protein